MIQDFGMKFPDAADRFLTTFNSVLLPALVRYANSTANRNVVLRDLLSKESMDGLSGSLL